MTISRAVLDAVAEIADQLKVLLSKVTDLLQGQHQIDDHLSHLEATVTELRAQLVARKPAKAASAAITSRRSTSRTKPPVLPASADDARLLAVDMWDGKPSVAVARGAGREADVRFLNEGESSGHVTVRRADITSQKAVFSTSKGEVVLDVEQQ